MYPFLEKLKKRITLYRHEVEASSIILTILGMLFLGILLILLPSTSANTITGDDMVFEKSYPDFSTLLSSPVENYMAWTARLTNVFTLNVIFGSTPDSLTHLIALPLSLGLVALSSWFLFTSLFRLLQTKSPVAAGFVLSQVLTLVLCIYSFITYDNFYWIAGVVTYIFPIALCNIIVGYGLRLIQKPDSIRAVNLITIFFLSVVVGLYNEGFIVQCLSIIIACGLLSVIFLKKRSDKIFISTRLKRASLVAIIISLGLITAALTMKFAPGTAYREALNRSLYLVTDHSFAGLLKMTFYSTVHELKTFFIYNRYGIPLVFIATLTVAALLGPAKLSRRFYFYITLGSLLLPIVAFSSLAFAVHYAYQPAITDYSLITAYYFSYLGIIGATFGIFQLCLSKTPHKKPSSTVPVGSALLVASLTGIVILSTLALMRVCQIYNLINLQRKESIKISRVISDAKARGANTVTLPETTRYFTYCVPESTPDAWCNNAYSQYYGLKSIFVTSYVDAEAIVKQKEGKQ